MLRVETEMEEDWRREGGKWEKTVHEENFNGTPIMQAASLAKGTFA